QHSRGRLWITWMDRSHGSARFLKAGIRSFSSAPAYAISLAGDRDPNGWAFSRGAGIRGRILNFSAERLALEGGERWFLANARPEREPKAKMHLREKGFRAYLPKIKKTFRHARQFRDVQAPLFPRYMFLIIDPSRDRWLSIRSTVGVSSLFTCE